MANIPITNLPPTTAAQASSQVPAVQAGTTVYLTVDQIAQYTQTTYPITGITSITAQSPLSGGTITSSGTIGLTTSSITNSYLSTMASNTIKGNNTGSAANPTDLTVAQTMTMLGAAPLASPAFTGVPTAPTPLTSDASTTLATTQFVKSQGYGTGSVTSITAGTGLSGGTITTTGTIAIANTGVTAQYYGSASVVPVITVNAQGQITSASNATISITPSQVTGLGTMATQNASSVAITGGAIDQTTIGATTPITGKFTALTATGNSNFATIASGTWNGTFISVNYGGTGSSSASGARTNLGAAASGANSDITSLSGLTTPLSEIQGGTGYSSYTTGDILYASSSTTLARLNDVATGNALISGGVGLAPSWGKIGLTSHVSGTLPVANGGTGAITLTGYLVGNGTGAFTAVSTIPNAGLTNSAITIGSTSISLGSSSSTLAGLTTVTVTQDPTSALQLSTKQYVDNTVSTVANTTYHTAAGYATTADLGTVTYNNGTGGVGATLTNAGTQAALTIDGYTFTGTDVSNATRVLVKNETSAAYNGIYVVTNQGSGSTNWVLTRSTDFNATGSGPNYIETGAAAYVNNGTTNGATSWTMTTTGTITVGSTALIWSQISSSGNIQVSSPITKTGNTIGLGTVGVANGGTGLTTLTAYGLLYAASTSSVGQISPSTTGYALLSTGASSAPAFGQVSLTAGVTGTLPVANGGTGTATAFTTGSMVFAGASGTYTQNNSKLFWDNTNFRLGLNTASPNSTLTVVSNSQSTTPPSNSTLPAGTDLYIMGANSSNTRITQDAYGTGSYGVYTARSARGSAAAPTASQAGDILSQFTGRGYGATGFATISNGYFAISAAENFTDTAQGAYASVFTSATGNNSPTEAFRFGPAGQLGIGGATYGTSGQFFLSGGASAAPTWTTVTLATLGGVVPVASGGTNLTSYTTGDILYASASTTIASLADVATGSVLVSGGVGVAPSYSSSPTLTTSLTTPLHIGGTTASSTLTLESTSGAGTTDAILFKTGSQSERMRIDTSGNVGIGTSSPSYKLDVNGSFRQQNAFAYLGNYNAGATYPTQNLSLGISNNFSAGFGEINIWNTVNPSTNATTGIRFMQQTGASSYTDIMWLNNSGTVGIGAIAGASSYGKLTIGNGQADGAQTVQNAGLMFYNTGNWAQAGIWPIGGSGFAGSLAFGTVPSGSGVNTVTERMRIDSSGNVGIGTSSPTQKLQVSGTSLIGYFQSTTADCFIRIDETGGSNNILGGTNGVGYVGTSTNYPFTIRTNNTERARIDTSGNVSIGPSGTSTGVNLLTNAQITGATSAFANLNNGVVQSGVTTQSVSYYSNITSAAASFTTNSSIHFYANPATGGSGSIISNQYGFFSENTVGTQGAATVTNAYGFYGNLASGTNRWNLYMAGTANNYMAGALGVGTTTVGVAGSINAIGAITFQTTTNNQSYTTTGAGTITISSGTTGSINNMSIGATTASTGAFTTLSASSTVSGTGFSTYLASPPAIGGTTAAAGSFTTLSASSTVSGTGFSTYLASPPAIGGTTAAAGTFTTLGGTTITASTQFTGPGTGLTGTAASLSIGGNAANVTGTVAVANGGTGANTLTANNVILGNGTSAVQFVAPGTSGNILTSNGTTWTSAAASSGSGRLIRAPQVLTSGTSYTTPAGCNTIYIEMVGGGQSGAGTSSGTGFGGGAGGFVTKYFAVTPSTAYTYAVGAGGASAGSASQNSGGNTTFTVGATTVKAAGSGSGSNANGDFSTTGGSGFPASTVPGGGGCSYFGGQTAYGSGGVGGNSGNSGAGSAGVIIVWEYT